MGILVEQIHDSVIDPVRNLVIEIPDIDPLGDVLGEGLVGDDPVQQISFNGVHGDKLRVVELPGKCFGAIHTRMGRMMFLIRQDEPAWIRFAYSLEYRV